MSGTHSRGRFPGFFGAGAEQVHLHETTIDADHPAVLVGRDNGPTPAELLLNALASYLMAGLANIAPARGVELHGVRCDVEGDAEAEELANLVTQSVRRSAVYNVVTNGTPLTVDAG